MPISMKAVLQSIHYSEKAVEIAQKEIDAKLCDPGWCFAWRFGETNNYNWRFLVSVKFSQAQKEELRESYMACGWGWVSFPIDIEEDARPFPGSSVMLYQNKPNTEL
jgi:hypothetical protein